MKNQFHKIIFLLILIAGCEGDDIVEEEPPVAKYDVWQAYGGGVIIYVDPSGIHGLIADTVDWGLVPWSNGENINIDTDNDDGEGNTEKIVAAQGEGNYAAFLCYHSEVNGYSDWYLPSRNESIKLLYLPDNLRFNFGRKVCWSSTQNGSDHAFYIDVVFGNDINALKQTPLNFHAVRKF